MIRYLDLYFLRTNSISNISYALAQRKVTHVIVQRNVCASKLHQYLHVRSNLTKVVTSEWITDSIANGKRLSEWKYRVLKDEVCLYFTPQPIGSTVYELTL